MGYIKSSKICIHACTWFSAICRLIIVQSKKTTNTNFFSVKSVLKMTKDYCFVATELIVIFCCDDYFKVTRFLTYL